MTTKAQSTGFPTYAMLSMAAAVAAVLFGYGVAQMRWCNPWVGCLIPGIFVGLGLALLGLAFGIVSWRKAEHHKVFTMLAIVLNVSPFLFVLWLF